MERNKEYPRPMSGWELSNGAIVPNEDEAKKIQSKINFELEAADFLAMYEEIRREQHGESREDIDYSHLITFDPLKLHQILKKYLESITKITE